VSRSILVAATDIPTTRRAVETKVSEIVSDEAAVTQEGRKQKPGQLGRAAFNAAVGRVRALHGGLH
jgi:hypothetical protein